MKAKDTGRSAVEGARRIVVKIGSRVLVQKTGRPDLTRIKSLVKDLAKLRKAGREIVVVSSGAIGCGVDALKLKTRPTSLPELQMAAAVGQTRLMSFYDKFFSAEKCRVGQVLLTHGDLSDRRRHLNARNTMMALLRNGIVPIVNENDVVAVDEIKFGDNDKLAALVALLIEADLLVLLTTVDGFQAPAGKGGRMRRVASLKNVTDEELQHAQGKGSHLSTGGMASKLQAANMVARVSAPVVIADGRKAGILSRVLRGEDTGTMIMADAASAQTMLAGRKRWIAFFQRAQGAIIVDDGARAAIETKGKSLLPIGIRNVEGSFAAGTVVNVRTVGGVLFACGVVDYSSDQIRKIMGHRTDELAGILGFKDYDEVIHRDNMVVLGVELGGV
ncbi:MAG TPA: glutamate 5-kinase [Kiritimatiellia bacterium]|nr:glutamate 5-kinase [Kiritimatiellia bacterium]